MGYVVNGYNGFSGYQNGRREALVPAMGRGVVGLGSATVWMLVMLAAFLVYFVQPLAMIAPVVLALLVLDLSRNRHVYRFMVFMAVGVSVLVFGVLARTGLVEARR
jgi:hypothetical protein